LLFVFVWATGRGMRAITSLLIFGVFLVSCKREEEIDVSQTRRLTTKDGNLKIDATSDERFRNAKPAPFKGDLPDGWLKLPPTQFRLMNYRFGESGLGEVYLSISGGSVLDNANRWVKQFAAESLTLEGLKDLPKLGMLNATAHELELQGTYASGMGQAPKAGYALYGALASIQGRLYTVKMIGPEKEVAVGKADAKRWIKSLKVAE